MANIIVQPKVLNEDGVTYDNLIMQQAVNATNAENATIAQYASSDTSKGTIEERLTNIPYKNKKVIWSGIHNLINDSYIDIPLTEEIAEKKLVLTYGSINTNTNQKYFSQDIYFSIYKKDNEYELLDYARRGTYSDSSGAIKGCLYGKLLRAKIVSSSNILRINASIMRYYDISSSIGATTITASNELCLFSIVELVE